MALSSAILVQRGSRAESESEISLLSPLSSSSPAHSDFRTPSASRCVRPLLRTPGASRCFFSLAYEQLPSSRSSSFLFLSPQPSSLFTPFFVIPPTAVYWWGNLLTLCGPSYVAMEGLSSLLFAQKAGQIGRDIADEAESYQFVILIAAATAFVAAAWWVVIVRAAPRLPESRRTLNLIQA
ncbi:hypothetical protein DEU56DRAFT_931834 [Suillus clintonianus]|uniref:uncharacterized protein n=1 Tax=Suillus clintonianus TaxID=1904413 RepID=UPI001B85CA1E|nr:uncharacterized protein DEU56DRAFT_931834 [Suillus clintonianus]KAG2116791.1 hypothetical protein DEU56DRAFT_931834 [Suillus clintonianus]